jgi:hypothetical protein
VRDQLASGISGLPRDSFTVAWALGETIRCTLANSVEHERAAILAAMHEVLSAEPDTPFATAFVTALFARPSSTALMQPVIGKLSAHPSCGVRSAALSLTFLAAQSDDAREALIPVAQKALHSTCWRLQATARARLVRSGAVPDESARLPSFLQTR